MNLETTKPVRAEGNEPLIKRVIGAAIRAQTDRLDLREERALIVQLKAATVLEKLPFLISGFLAFKFNPPQGPTLQLRTPPNRHRREKAGSAGTI
jgi:hypothetical protein